MTTPDTPSPQSSPDLQFSLAAQFVRVAAFQSDIPPYQLKAMPRVSIGGEIHAEPLPEAGHWRVLLTTRINCSQQDDPSIPVCSAVCTVEAISVLTGFTHASQIREVLVHHVAGTLIGTTRERISTLMSQSGMPEISLPLFDRPTLERFAAKLQVDQPIQVEA